MGAASWGFLNDTSWCPSDVVYWSDVLHAVPLASPLPRSSFLLLVSVLFLNSWRHVARFPPPLPHLCHFKNFDLALRHSSHFSSFLSLCSQCPNFSFPEEVWGVFCFPFCLLFRPFQCPNFSALENVLSAFFLPLYPLHCPDQLFPPKMFDTVFPPFCFSLFRLQSFRTRAGLLPLSLCRRRCPTFNPLSSIFSPSSVLSHPSPFP